MAENPFANAITLGLNGGLDLFDEHASAFSTYDLASSLGPISSEGNAFGNPGSPFHTSLGDLRITAFGPASFTAAPGSPAVPEASTTVSFGLLLALGMGGIVAAARRRKQAPVKN